MIRAAQRFLAARRVTEGALRFDVVAIENHPGRRPLVRLHRDTVRARKRYNIVEEAADRMEQGSLREENRDWLN